MPSLKATIGADSSQMQREFLMIQRMAGQTGMKIQTGLNVGHSGTGGIIRETIVVLRELLTGNFNARTAGSISILSQRLNVLKFFVKDNAIAAKELAVASAVQAEKSLVAAAAAQAQVVANREAIATMRVLTAGELMAAKADEDRAAASIASAEADRVKAASALQAAEAMEAEGVAARFSIGPLGWVAAALIVAGTAAYFLVRHFRAVAEETRNLRDLMDNTTINFSEQAGEIEKAAQAAQEFDDWLKKLADSETDFGEAVDETMESMRERARLEHEIASEKGASRKQLAQMEIDSEKKQLEFLQAAREQAKKNTAYDTAEASAAAQAANNPQNKGIASTASEKAKEAGEIVKEIQKAMKDNPWQRGDIIGTGLEGATLYGPDRPSNADDKFDTKKYGSMSLNEATEKFNTLVSDAAKLAEIQKRKDDLAAEKKSLTAKDAAEEKRLNKEINKLSNDLALKREFLPQVVDKAKNKGEHAHVSELQRIGGDIIGRGAALNEARKHTALLHHVVRNTAHLGGRTATSLSVNNVNYGDMA